MTTTEFRGVWGSLSGIQKAMATAVALVGFGASVAMLPLQVQRNTASIARLLHSDSVQTVDLTTIKMRMERDSTRQERMLCLQEVQMGIRPQTDLERVCVR